MPSVHGRGSACSHEVASSRDPKNRTVPARSAPRLASPANSRNRAGHVSRSGTTHASRGSLVPGLPLALGTPALTLAALPLAALARAALPLGAPALALSGLPLALSAALALALAALTLAA